MAKFKPYLPKKKKSKLKNPLYARLLNKTVEIPGVEFSDYEDRNRSYL